MFITLKKFLEILDLCYENGRKVTILIILGLVLSALLEMLSLGALIPIISIIFSENETGINLIDQIISNYTFEQKIVYLAAGLFFIFYKINLPNFFIFLSGKIYC